MGKGAGPYLCWAHCWPVAALSPSCSTTQNQPMCSMSCSTLIRATGTACAATRHVPLLFTQMCLALLLLVIVLGVVPIIAPLPRIQVPQVEYLHACYSNTVSKLTLYITFAWHTTGARGGEGRVQHTVHL